MSRFSHLALSVLTLGAAQSALAATVGLQGSPTLEVYWQNATIEGAPLRYVGSVQFGVDEEGNFFVTGSTPAEGVSCDTVTPTDPNAVNFCWGTGANEDLITIGQNTYGNLDPFFTFSFSAIDFGAPSVFIYTFSSPVAPPIAGPASYSLDLAGSFTDGSPLNGGSLSMAAPNTMGVLEGILNGTTVIAGIGTGLVDAAGPPNSATYGPFATSGPYDCSLIGGCTSFGVRLAFLGSGSADAYSFTGRFEITEAVPVPAAVWLLGSALGALGFVRRRAG